VLVRRPANSRDSDQTESLAGGAAHPVEGGPGTARRCHCAAARAVDLNQIHKNLKEYAWTVCLFEYFESSLEMWTLVTLPASCQSLRGGLKPGDVAPISSY